MSVLLGSLFAAISQAASLSGSSGDPVLRVALYIAAVVVSPAALIAFIRAAVLFGAMKQSIESFPKALEKLSVTLDSVASTMGEHHARISVVEAGVEGLESRERQRENARPVYDRRAAP